MIERGALASIIDGKPAPDFVVRLAADGFDVTLEELRGGSREHPLVHQRQVLMAALRRLTGLSYPAIGRLLDRDHTTAMNACARCRQVPRLARAVDVLCIEAQRQWAIDNGKDVPMRGQEVLPL